MEKKLTTLTHWWPLFIGLSFLFTVAGIFGYTVQYIWIFFLCWILCLVLLLWQFIMIFVALLQREWWRALASFICTLLTAVLLFFSLTIYILGEAMDNAHPSGEDTEVVDSLEVEPLDTLEVL